MTVICKSSHYSGAFHLHSFMSTFCGPNWPRGHFHSSQFHSNDKTAWGLNTRCQVASRSPTTFGRDFKVYVILAMREQESTNISANEVVFGHTVWGQLTELGDELKNVVPVACSTAKMQTVSLPRNTQPVDRKAEAHILNQKIKFCCFWQTHLFRLGLADFKSRISFDTLERRKKVQSYEVNY